MLLGLLRSHLDGSLHHQTKLYEVRKDFMNFRIQDLITAKLSSDIFYASARSANTQYFCHPVEYHKLLK